MNLRGRALGDLEPLELKVAHLRYAGASQGVIAYLAQCSQGHIEAILKRPRVADYLLKLTALHQTDLAPAVRNLNEAIEYEADHAFEVEKQAMDRLAGVWDDAEPTKLHVQAQLGSAQLAQDILDRAGKRAPTKIQQQIRHEVAPATIEHLGRIMQEATSVDITPGGVSNEDDSGSLSTVD